MRVLGTAAGGGYPQWNCCCHLCQEVRRRGRPRQPRLHASLAVSATGRNWYLVNATPDVRFQVESFPALHPGPGVRESPIHGVLLTDAELDHTIGLLVLREGAQLDVYASRAVLAALAEDFPVRRVLQFYARFRWVEVNPREAFSLDEDRLGVEGFRVGVKKPRYSAASKIDGDWVIGYRFEDLETRGIVIYTPVIERWTAELAAELGRADCAFVDGTFWTEDEVVASGVGTLSARDMGHLPISGREGSAERLALLPAKRKIYIHLNNTNPVLDEGSREHRFLADRGLEVGWDGMEVEV